MADAPPNPDELISQFCGITGVNAVEAREYLAANAWNLETAVAEYYPDQGGAQDYESESDDVMERNPPGGRTLGGGPAPAAPQTSSSSSTSKAPKKKFATLGDLGSGDAGGEPSDDDRDDPQDLFAGGEKSGLAVQNPDDLKNKIIEKAKKGIHGGAAPPAEPRKSYFTGNARTLGGDDTPSEFIADTRPRPQQPAPRVSRTLNFWNDGFSVDDGDLYRTDDPRNAQILDGIRQGRAPLSIMNVEPGQEVDVEIKQHDSNYVKPKPKYKPFSGTGQRLGSPTPSPGTHAPAPAAAAAATTTTSSSTSTETPAPQVDESQPTVMLQIRLGDGTRLSSRFNTSHTIGDVYSFVDAASPASQARPWVLMTTFPSTELSDKSAQLGDLKEYKRGGVVVQKWT